MDLISDIEAFMQNIRPAVSEVITYGSSFTPEVFASQTNVSEYPVEAWLAARMLTRCLPDDI
jgi:hypothetical protein